MSRQDPSDAVFTALADQTRRRLVIRLSQRGAASSSDLAREFPITRQAIAKHMAALEEAGLVTGERVGRERRYHLTPAPLTEAMSWMTSVGAEWDERLARLRTVVGRSSPR